MCISSYIIVLEREIIKGVLKMVIKFENEFDMCKILRHKSDVAVMIKTVVDEMEFPEFIVKRLDTGRERVFRYDEYDLAEDYYNYLSNDLYHEHNDVARW